MKTLFVSTDISATGNNAVKFAVHYATAIESNLIVFHAAHLPPFKPTISEADLLQLTKDAVEAEQKNLDQVVSNIYDDLGLKRNNERVSVAVKIGAFTADTIMKAGKDHHADLLIVGTHGATGLKLLGSTTCEIIFNSETPVLAIPPQSEYRKIETMVYATDLKNTVNELRCIVPFANKMNAVIEIFNLYFGMNKTKPILEIKGLMEQLKYERIKIIIQKGKKEITMLEQLEQYLENRRPEILVMFPEERSVFDKIFIRSKTEELAYHAKLPLLTYLKSKVEQPSL